MRIYNVVWFSYILFWFAFIVAIFMYNYGWDAKPFVIGYVVVIGDITLFVLAANIKLHKHALLSGVKANSVGVKATLLSCLLFTPIEAVIVLPAINLLRLKSKNWSIES